MIPGSTNPCFPSGAPGISIYGVSEDVVSSNIDQGVTNSSSAVAAVAVSDTHPNPTNFLYNLSVLKDKVHQAQSLASMFISSDHTQQLPQSTAIAIASMGTVIQEIIVTASSLMFTCQQISLGVGGTPSANNINDNNHHSTNTTTANHLLHHHHHQQQQQHHRLKVASGPALNQQNGGRNGDSHFGDQRGEGSYTNNDALDWYGECYNTNENTITRTSSITVGAHNGDGRGDLSAQKGVNDKGLEKFAPKDYDIVELDAADLLAKYTHYCQICGKGFKRDANLRMHMRAHGDEYKSSAALSNPVKNMGANGKEEGLPGLPRKYSCPHEGCRWNRKHAKFQPLKSMICVKNHYKRSHCPKMYVCKRCSRKQFSVLSDLRTHEKHCGDLRWQCSCGTTFSRKDKLLGHVALFIGHTPAISSLAKMGKVEQDQDQGQMQLQDR